MIEKKRLRCVSFLDSFCIITGAMVPSGLILGNAVFESMVSLVGAGWIIRCIIARENPLPDLLKHPFVLPWLFWFASIIISVAWNGSDSYGWAHSVVLIRFLVYFSALLDISGRRPVSRALIIGLAAGVLLGFVNIIMAYSIGYDIVGKPLTRYLSKLKEMSRIANLVVFAAPFFLAWSFLDSRLTRKKRALIALIGCIAMVELFQTQIRTAQLAGIAGILTCFIFVIIKKKSRAAMIVTLVLAGLSIPILIQYGFKLNLHSMYDRFSIWKVAWSMWLDHPVVGVSPTEWKDVYRGIIETNSISPYVSPGGFTMRSPDTPHAHNLFLQLLSCTGILGLLSFCWLFFNNIRILFYKNLSSWHAGLISWPVVFLFIGLTGWNIFRSQYQTVFSYFIILTALSMRQDER